ncbi:MAG: DUF190 domain-containing protein [Chloroflexi bacterium]|nr:DUF190 domain-containing protein [Chloroflexota bacterium]
MELSGAGLLVRIFIGEMDKCEGKPLYKQIVNEARQAGIAGATVLRGIMGYGANSKVKTTSILRLSEDLPLVVEIVDTEEKINDFLPTLDRLMDGGLITLEKVRILKYSHHQQV